MIQTLLVGCIDCGFVLLMGSYSAFLTCTLSAIRMDGLELMENRNRNVTMLCITL
ncbi:hypothetical protein [Desulfonatronum sp. SC1]|uniref:hypothetical protein n=1 Tax=Desulfonatronum sp. SC1 TaxID=2109626 RepID=UPI001304E60C|nr:hypothetical protein [Desulfonatronum sp. SC1]